MLIKNEINKKNFHSNCIKGIPTAALSPAQRILSVLYFLRNFQATLRVVSRKIFHKTKFNEISENPLRCYKNRNTDPTRNG